MSLTDSDSEKREQSPASNLRALERIESSYREMIAHDGYGEMRVEVKILKRGQKEVIVHFGKQYRYVVDVE
ncbi:MAG: hypothetical protein AAGJ28_26065 [Pseudomonadota bacterium]